MYLFFNYFIYLLLTQWKSKLHSEGISRYLYIYIFIIQKLYLFQLGDVVLLEGEHVYPFKVSLPFELPSTYKDEYGYVRYKAKVVLNMSRNSKIYKEIQFEVNSPINLNDEPFLAVSIVVN